MVVAVGAGDARREVEHVVVHRVAVTRLERLPLARGGDDLRAVAVVLHRRGIGPVVGQHEPAGGDDGDPAAEALPERVDLAVQLADPAP
jgi:hypothetical protein